MSATGARMHIRPGEEVTEGSLLHELPELTHVNVVSLIDPEVEQTAELIVGRMTLPPGGEIVLHAHTHAEAIFVLEGTVTAQLGKGIADIEGPGAACFPAGAVHGLRAAAGATCLLCYPRGDVSQRIGTTLVEPGADTSGWPNPNIIAAENLSYRWALVEEFEPAVPVEPTKGSNMTLRYLLDPTRGAPDLVVGTGAQKPNIHYTIHRHEPPEIFYVLEGNGVIHVGGESFEVRQGSTVYVPSRVTHGIDTFDGPMRTFWVYGLDRCGADWTWEAVEPVYNHPRR